MVNNILKKARNLFVFRHDRNNRKIEKKKICAQRRFAFVPLKCITLAMLNSFMLYCILLTFSIPVVSMHFN